MAIEPHVHSYHLRVKIVVKGPTMRAVCKHPECDKELSALEIMDYLDWVEKYKDGLKQIGAEF